MANWVLKFPHVAGLTLPCLNVQPLTSSNRHPQITPITQKRSEFNGDIFRLVSCLLFRLLRNLRMALMSKKDRQLV